MPLYVKLWLAVVAAVLVVALAFGYLWRISALEMPERDIVLRNEAGDVLGQARLRPNRIPGQGVEFRVPLKDGTAIHIHMPPRPRQAGEAPPARPWLRGPSGFWWLIGFVSLAVAIGSYPVVRHLTGRLNQLSKGVARFGEGDLGARVDEEGSDEVAFLARRFNETAQRVQVLVQSHKSLLANASHELRSPLARIRMALELSGPAANPVFRDELNRNVAELDLLIDEILLASRLDAQQAELGTVEPVDLVGLAAEECARVNAQLQVPQSQPGATGELLTPGIPKLLRRAVRNLLENARRYSENEITVTLLRQAQSGPPCITLIVDDRGPGVPPGERQRIFEPFFRLPGATERDGGVGLGLALVRSIVQRHGGTVQCEANPAGGARFVVQLPVAES
jgi:two-component system, OmpR family, sensor kinase